MKLGHGVVHAAKLVFMMPCACVSFNGLCIQSTSL